MIGNDIVDLNLAKTESNWRRKGFLEKQFTDFEIKEILSSVNPFMQVWLFWSMKEAAYKCYTQEYQKRFFAPKKFSCKIVSNSKGIVQIEDEIYLTKSTITENYIHTIANEGKGLNLTSDFFLIETNKASSFVREKLFSNFSSQTKIIKNKIGIPSLYLNKKKLDLSFSISYHGNYGGFVIQE